MRCPSLPLLLALALPACTPAPSAQTETTSLAPTTTPAAPSAARPPAPPAVSALATKLEGQVVKCLADAACDAEQAASLVRRADEAGAGGMVCFAFYYGIDVPVDMPRARACFERDPASRCDEGSSPGIELATLAAMLIDGQGGPADPDRARALLAGCYRDASVQGLQEEAEKRREPALYRAPLDFCKDVGGTTPTIAQCHGVDASRAASVAKRVAREMKTRLDAKGLELAGKARDAWAAYARRTAEVYGDMYRDGSLQSGAELSHRNELDQQRNEALAAFFDYKPTPGADPAEADRAVADAFKAAPRDPQHKKLLEAARRAFDAYRNAEVALYVHAFGPTLGKAEVERDVRVRLAKGFEAELKITMER